MALIQLDYTNAVIHAKKLEAAAEKCEEIIRAMKAQSGNSEHFWKGNSGNSMRAKMNETIQELYAVQQNLQSAAASIRRVAKELKKKDQELASVFK